MKLSDQAIQLIARSEGFSSTPYRCPAGIPTIGYGSTFYPDGRRVEMDDMPVTEPDALATLQHEAGRVAGQIDGASKVSLTQGQFDALVSFAYNLGFGTLIASTLWRKVQANNFAGAADQFDRWIHGGGKILPGLITRRAAEKAMFEGVENA